MNASTTTSNLELRKMASKAHTFSCLLVANQQARLVGMHLSQRGYDKDRAAKFAARFFDQEAFELLMKEAFWNGFKYYQEG